MGRHDGSTQSLSAADEPAAKTVSFIHKLAASDAFKSLFSGGHDPGRRGGRLSRRPRARGVAAIAPPRRLGLCDGEHAADDAADAGRLLVAAPARGQRGRNDRPRRPCREKHRVRLAEQEIACDAELFEELPPALRQFSLKSLRLQARVAHLDRSMAAATGSPSRRGARRWPLRSSGCRRPSRDEAARSRETRRGGDLASPRACAAALLAALVGKSSLRNGNLTARHGRRFFLPPLSDHAAAQRRRSCRFRAALRRGARRRRCGERAGCASPRRRKARPSGSSSPWSNWRRRATSRR